MSLATEQRAPGLLPPVQAPVSHHVGVGEHHRIEQLVRGFEVLANKIGDVDHIPLDLFERFARALNGAERAALTRVHLLEEATDH